MAKYEYNERTPLIGVRAFSPEAHQALHERAREAGVSTSQLVRRWVAEKLEPQRFTDSEET